MSYTIYDFIQSYCYPQLQKSHEVSMEYRSSSMPPNQLEQIIFDVREFFSQRRLIYFTDSSSVDAYLFLSLSQLLWHQLNRSSLTIPYNLKPYYYLIPVALQKRYKAFFCDLLQIKNQLDGKDLLHIVEQIKKKYGTKPIDKDDLTLLQNTYTLLIEQYSNIFNSNIDLYLPNVDCVLHPGSQLYFYPFEREQICKLKTPSKPQFFFYFDILLAVFLSSVKFSLHVQEFYSYHIKHFHIFTIIYDKIIEIINLKKKLYKSLHTFE